MLVPQEDVRDRITWMMVLVIYPSSNSVRQMLVRPVHTSPFWSGWLTPFLSAWVKPVTSLAANRDEDQKSSKDSYGMDSYPSSLVLITSDFRDKFCWYIKPRKDLVGMAFR